MVSRENRSERGSMDYVDIKAHLDKIVDTLEELQALQDFSSRARFYLVDERKEYMVYENIDVIASTMGLGLCTENYKSEYCDFIAYFEYRGYKFQQFCKHGDLDVAV